MSAQQVNSAAERVPPPTPPTVQWEGDRSEGKIRVTVNSRSYFVTSTGADAAKMQEIFDTIQSNLNEAYTKFQSTGDQKALGDTLTNFKKAAAGSLICRYTPQGVAFYKPTETNYKNHVYLMQRVNSAALQNLGLKIRPDKSNAASVSASASSRAIPSSRATPASSKVPTQASSGAPASASRTMREALNEGVQVIEKMKENIILKRRIKWEWNKGIKIQCKS